MLGSKTTISPVVFRMSGIAILQLRRRNIIASSPYLNLFLAMFLNRFEFVQSLQCSIVSLIEPPVLDDGNVMAIKFLSGVVKGLDGSGEDGRIADIELISILLQRLACLDCLLDACVSERVPLDVSLTSVHPVNLFSLFQRLSP